MTTMAIRNAYVNNFDTLEVVGMITCNIGVSILFRKSSHLIFYALYSIFLLSASCIHVLGVTSYSVCLISFFVLIAVVGYFLLATRIVANNQLDATKKAESELRKSRSSYENVIENSRDIIYTHDLDGKILGINSTVENILGGRKDDYIGKRVDSFILDDFKEEYEEYIKTITSRGVAEGFSRLIDVNGNTRVLEYRNAMSVDLQGNKIVICNSRDVTEQLGVQKALSESEEKFRNIFNSLHDPYYKTDLDGVIQIISPAIYEIFGYQAEELVGQYTSMLYKDPNERKLLLKELKNKGYARDFETVARKANGDLFHVSVNSFFVYDKQGEPIGMEGTVRDIDAAKSVQLKLEESESRYRDLVEHSQDLICIHDQNGKLLSFNSTFSKVLGYPPSRFLDANIREFIVDKYKKEFDKYLKDIVKSKHMSGYMQVKCLDGSHKILEYNNTLTTDKKGEIIIRGMSKNVTEAVLTQKALTKSEADYRNIFNSIPDVLYRTDMEGIITMLSPSVKMILGYDPSELIGMSIVDLYVNKERREEFIKSIDKKGFINNYENVLTKKDGTIIVTSANCYYLYNEDGQPVAIEGLIRDITTAKQIENKLVEAKTIAIEASRSKTEFIANVSHELRTPLNGILGLASLLKTTKLDHIQKDRVETIEQTTQVLSGIINDLLELSKLDAKKISLKPEPFNLEKAIEKIIKTFSPEAVKKGILLGYSIKKDVPNSVFLDKLRIQQILNDLVNNAIKFTDKGGVMLTISKVESSHDDIRLKFEVSDTGIGISKSNIAKLFKRFSQVEGSSKRKYTGTGLGLAICKDLVELMGGKIGVESSKGKGSNFWFIVDFQEPVILSTHDDIASEQDFKGVDKPTIKEKEQLKILLIEDNHVNRKVTLALLKEYGYTTDYAEDGKKGLQKIRKEKFDLVLLDYQMPDMNGEQVLSRLSKMNDAPPVIILSANALEENKEKLIKKGAIRYFTKPLDHQELDLFIVNNLLKKPTNSKRKQIIVSEKIEIDKQTVKYLKNLPGFDFKEIIEEYLMESSRQIPLITNAIKKNNLGKVIEIAHTLKGSTTSIGLSSISKLFFDIEQDAQKEDSKKMLQNLKTLRKQHRILRNMINESNTIII